MTITTIDPLAGVPEANTAIFAAVRDYGADMPTKVFAAISAYYPSPVDRIVNSAEALYAAAQAGAPGEATDALAAACAQLTDFCTANSWHEIGQTDRGLKMSGACRRIVGLGAQDEADDPAPLDQFATD